MEYTQCYLGVGSNIENPRAQVAQAMDILSDMAPFHHCVRSSFFSSKAMTLEDEKHPDYINAVMRVETSISPLEVLQIAQKLEHDMGRQKTEKAWQSRVIDIDILMMTGVEMHSARLTIPHPGLLQRPFVIHPLAEIDPQARLPNNMTAKQYAAKICDNWNTQKTQTTNE